MTGAEYIAEFLKQRGTKNIFLITGGACAFIVDAIGRNRGLKYICFQHEQAAAMAADALWRIDKTVGTTVVTSGPGATNLITGIACSYFDSIPTLHITGQVNQNEIANYRGARVRQAGFQETKIVDMVKPITKYAVQVKTGEELKRELTKAYNLAISDRKGPVLIDVPMDVQKAEVGDEIAYSPPNEEIHSAADVQRWKIKIQEFFQPSERPLVLFGAGVGLAGAEIAVAEWLKKSGIPFVSSWNGLTYFNHDLPNYMGNIGVYGNRGANFILQNADRILVLGSRLDNRQRSGDIVGFGMSAKFLVLDVDTEELKKYDPNKYETLLLNLKHFPDICQSLEPMQQKTPWIDFFRLMKKRYFGKYPSSTAESEQSLSPYAIVQEVNRLISRDAIVIADDGANLCWVFQAFHRTGQTLFTAGGNSPMGYSFPASIGAALHQPNRQVIVFTGDGSFQMNIQELQTMAYHKCNIKLIILNNYGYGIIKQFQDLYFESRYFATGEGYSQPNFAKVVEAYNIPYHRVKKMSDLKPEIFEQKGPAVIEVVLHPNTLIEPKLEMGRPIHDQFPYLSDGAFDEGMRFVPTPATARKG